MATPQLMILKNGSLHLLEGGKEREFESPFAREKLEAQHRLQENRSWKTGSTEEGPNIVPRSMLWGASQSTSATRATFRHIQRVGNRLYYVLSLPKSQGLFYFDLAADKEIRLFHREDFDPHGFFVNDDFTVFTTRKQADGTIHLIKLDDQGKEVRQLTTGDCQDEQPFPAGDWLYYQSAGLARTPEGCILDRSPLALFRVNLRSGAAETLAESENTDFFLPRVDRQGCLFFIRRPYDRVEQQGFWVNLKDVLLFPYRLAVAVFGFLNVFSMIFGKNPLMTAGGPEDHRVDLSRQIIHGRMIDILENVRREGRKAAVPRSWQLVRRSPDGSESVVGENVLWYDLDSAGQPVFTDGFRIVRGDGESVAASEDLILGLSVAPEPA